MLRSYSDLLQSSDSNRQVSHPSLVGFGCAEVAPLHKIPAKSLDFSGLLLPRSTSNRAPSHPLIVQESRPFFARDVLGVARDEVFGGDVEGYD